MTVNTSTMALLSVVPLLSGAGSELACAAPAGGADGSALHAYVVVGSVWQRWAVAANGSAWLAATDSAAPAAGRNHACFAGSRSDNDRTTLGAEDATGVTCLAEFTPTV